MNKNKSIKKVGIYGIIGNIFLLIIKAIVGFTSKSQAMIADSINSAGDIFASLMTFIGNKIASEPNDEDHNFGHGKAEYIFSLIISISMILVSVKLMSNSFVSLVKGSNVYFSWFLVVVCIITILVKIALFFYAKHIYSEFNSILVEANMKDHRNDCVLTLCTLISTLFTLNGIFWFDGVVGILISAWIFYSGTSIFIESYNILMDSSIDEDTKKVILDIIQSYPEIKLLKDLKTSPVGDKHVVFIIIEVNGEMSTFDSHNLADKLEQSISNLDNIYRTIVHIEPA